MFRVITTWAWLTPPSKDRPPTIYEALKSKLGREPSRDEILADMRRIRESVLVDLATQGNLPHQRRRYE